MPQANDFKRAVSAAGVCFVSEGENGVAGGEEVRRLCGGFGDGFDRRERGVELVDGWEGGEGEEVERGLLRVEEVGDGLVEDVDHGDADRRGGVVAAGADAVEVHRGVNVVDDEMDDAARA